MWPLVTPQNSYNCNIKSLTFWNLYKRKWRIVVLEKDDFFYAVNFERNIESIPVCVATTKSKFKNEHCWQFADDYNILNSLKFVERWFCWPFDILQVLRQMRRLPWDDPEVRHKLPPINTYTVYVNLSFILPHSTIVRLK